MENVVHENEKAIPGAIKIDEKEIRDHLDGLVRQSVEETLNGLLNAEADAIKKAALVTEKLRTMKLDKVAEFVETSVDETLSYMDFPYEHWSRLHPNNGLERIMKEIRRRTRVVGSFPDGNSALMLVGARLRHISTTKWGTRQYMNTCKLYDGGVL